MTKFFHENSINTISFVSEVAQSEKFVMFIRIFWLSKILFTIALSLKISYSNQEMQSNFNLEMSTKNFNVYDIYFPSLWNSIKLETYLMHKYVMYSVNFSYRLRAFKLWENIATGAFCVQKMSDVRFGFLKCMTSVKRGEKIDLCVWFSSKVQ